MTDALSLGLAMTRHLCATTILIAFCATALAQESPEQWFADGQATAAAAKRLQPIEGPAKNIILFIGDGMGVSTVTAARILAGQLKGMPGEENVLSFEKMPYLALSKTYSTNAQTPDSAATMSAIMTGIKTKSGAISVNQNAVSDDPATIPGNEATTLLEIAEQRGMATGIVTTTTITHATPAACYAHAPSRGWETDTALPDAARAAGFPDIARQLIEFPHGDGIEVVLGGGRSSFLPTNAEDSSQSGLRSDGRDLTAEWTKKYPDSAYVSDRQALDAIDPTETKHLLGLFNPVHLKFTTDRSKQDESEPTLAEMTRKAISMLESHDTGYFLMVEGGRIDHAHHLNNAYRALNEAVAFAGAVEVAMNATNERETLIIVTADHSHVMTIAGYPKRGNPIFGKVTYPGEPHEDKNERPDKTGKPYTTLSYANGPGNVGASDAQPAGAKTFQHGPSEYQDIATGRPDLSTIDTESESYLQETAIPLSYETHGGEDVAIYAQGPRAHLIHGVLEQNVLFHIMLAAIEP